MAAQKRLRSDQHQDLADPENIGGRADTSSKRPRASTGLEGQDEPVQCSSPSQVDVAQDIEIPPRRYATRKSTQVARPAKAAGLVPRTKAEISFEAAAKKEKKKAKAQRVMEKKARVAEGIAKLGRLQQERIAADTAEERDLRTARPVQGDGPGAREVPNRAPHNSGSHPLDAKRLPRGLYSSSSSSEDDLRDTLQPIRLKSTRRTPPSADGEGSMLDPSPDNEELPDDANIDKFQDDANADEFDKNPEADGSPYDHAAELGDNDFAAEFEDEPEADELEDDPEADEDGFEEGNEDGFEEGDEDGDGDDAEPDAAAHGKLSKAQKRIQKRIELRQMISRSAPAISRPRATTSAKSAHSTEASHAGTKKKPKNAPEAIFRSDWKANLVERQRPKPAPTGVSTGRSVASKSTAAPSRPSATPARASNSASASSRPSQTPSRRPPQTPSQSSHMPGGTSGWKAALQPPRSVGRPRNAGEGSTSEGDDPAQTNALRFGGFTDADVSSTPEYALATGGLRRKSKLIVQAVEESEDDDNGPGARAPVRRRPRRAASEVPEEESRSSRNLPGFIKPFLEPCIIPTVIDYYGAKENPWDLQELGRDELLDLCQTLVDEVLPRMGHIVKKSELIYKLTQQAIYAWRSNFAQVAICAVQEAIKTKFGPKRQIHEVKRWVAAAIASGGEAMWARPKTRAARAEGKLQSKYVLKTFASHLTSTTGSLHDYGYPGGALSLAAAAVKHVFPMFETGVFVPAGAFSGTNIENDTSDWYTKTVSIFVRKPDHFNVLLRQAAKLATATKAKARKVNPREREVSVEFSRSSPPLEDHELDMV